MADHSPLIRALDLLPQKAQRTYDILLIPGHIQLDEDFLKNQCGDVAPHVDFIRRFQPMFLYNGLLYTYLSKPSQSGLQPSVSVTELNAAINGQVKSSDSVEYKMQLNRQIQQISQVEHESKEDRLEFGHTHHGYRRLNIGPGQMRICDAGEIQSLKQEANSYQTCLRREFFRYYQDARIPYTDPEITDDFRCFLCQELLNEPVRGDACKHEVYACRACFDNWYGMFLWGGVVVKQWRGIKPSCLCVLI